eukprot:TRINITY_DN4730_c0_g1_i1.p1 TRINITY_DN4730_c0_g1~~TRINITY_DN4730_c0_g1_i1.p1  ORF type:complete len:746 (-),score=130.66 TRINITY_DN4730_c0_g1_i1:46-2283(-)
MSINPQTLLASLYSEDPNVRLNASRSLKNILIGRNHKKYEYAALGAIQALLTILSKRKQERDDIIIQCTAALGSFTCSEAEILKQVVDSPNSVPILFHLLADSNTKIAEASSRPINDIFTHPLTPTHIIIDSVINLTIGNENIVAPKVIINLLGHSSELLNNVAATVLTRMCKESRFATEVFLAHQALPSVISLLSKQTAFTIECTLGALTALTFPPSTQSLVYPPPFPPLNIDFNILNQCLNIMPKLLKDQRPRVRLLSAAILTNIRELYKMTNPTTEIPEDVLNIIKKAVVPTLVKLVGINENKNTNTANSTPSINTPNYFAWSEDAPSILTRLVEGSEELQKIASEGEAIPKLAALLKATMKEESDKNLQLFQKQANIMSSLAALSFHIESSRRQLVTHAVLPQTVVSLGSTFAPLRAAASRVFRSMSRSARSLRTSIVDVGAALPLLKLLDDKDLEVLNAASAAVCNLVLDFSAVKKLVLDNGGIRLLFHLTRESYPAPLRVNGVWGLKNLLFTAEHEVKVAVIDTLTFDGLVALLDDQNSEIQEQALGLIRNLVYKDPDRILQDDQVYLLLSKVETLLYAGVKEDCIKHALYILCNLGNGPERYEEAMMKDSILSRLLEFLSHKLPQLRVATVWCAINLGWPESEITTDSKTEENEMDTDIKTDAKNRDGGSLSRVARLRELGWERKMNELIDDQDVEVRERVRNCLSIFGRGSLSSSNVRTIRERGGPITIRNEMEKLD